MKYRYTLKLCKPQLQEKCPYGYEIKIKINCKEITVAGGFCKTYSEANKLGKEKLRHYNKCRKHNLYKDN